MPASTYSRRSASPEGSPRPSSRSSHTRRTSGDHRRYRGTISHCGRHSNDWLFGGFSFRDTVRDGVDRLRQQREKN